MTLYAVPDAAKAGISAEEIVARYRQRKTDLEMVNAKRRDVRDAYNGELAVSLPDIGRRERSAVANLLNTGLDQLAQRVASSMPQVFFPPRDPQSKREVTASEKRRKATLGWWEMNDLPVLQGYRARSLLGYASSPVLLWPDFDRGIPRWRVQNPMRTFAATCTNPGDMTPPDCIFSEAWTYARMKAEYPDAFFKLRRLETPRSDSWFNVLKFVDADELVTVAVGDMTLEEASAAPVYSALAGRTGGSRYEVLQRLPNRAGMCLAVTPGRITLDKALGQFDGVIGMYAMAARLMALEVIAVEKGVFPDTYLVSRPNEQAKFLTGPHDGRTGLVNIIAGGDIKEQGTAPGFQTNPTIDRLERAMRLTAGIPSELGGESASNIRTGRRGDAVLSAAIDFPLQEAQLLLAKSHEAENRRAIAVAKGWFGTRQTSYYVNWKGAKGHVDYTPNDIFTTDRNIVSFAHAGSDLNGQVIMVGQLTAMGVMSKQTAAEQLPVIEDPEQEHDRVTTEALETALLTSVQQKASAGEIAPADLAWLMQQVSTNRFELAEAMVKLDERVSQRQATQAQPMTPEAMPGLAGGTPAAGQAAQPTIPPGPESQQNLTGILGALRLGQRLSPAERPAVA
jgi:hypothetical protein